MPFSNRSRFGLCVAAVVASTGIFCALACSGPVETPTNAPEVKPVGSDSVPMFGGTIGRNLANPKAKNIPTEFGVEKGEEKNLKWKVKLGTVSYSGPVIADGRVYVGTDKGHADAAPLKGDNGVLICLRESDGKFLWQIAHEKLANEIDDHHSGLGSTPVVDGDKLYYVSNRCELVCASVEGKVLWSIDMIKEFGVYPGGLSGGLSNCSPLVVGDLIALCTSNGTNAENGKVENPAAPSFLVVDKKTKKVVWKSNAPGKDIMDGQWSSPAAAKVGDRVQVIFAGGDGWLRSFDMKTGELVWKFDCNPKGSVFKPGGRGDRNYILATPVIHDNKCYVGVGQEPDSGVGEGHLWCIDITKKPTNKEKDLSPVKNNFDPKAAGNKESGLVWHYGGKAPKNSPDGREFVFGRTISTVAIHDGLVYAAELAGFLHCVDAKTGERKWMFDLRDSTWASPFYADGKVFMGNDAGEVYVMTAGPKEVKPGLVELKQGTKTPPVAVNGVLYVCDGLYLYAIAKK